MKKSYEDMIWKKITYPGVQDMYLISEYGDIVNMVSNYHLTPYIDKDGYFRCSLRKIGLKVGSRNFIVHRLVAWEFCENPNKYPIVDHIDGNKQNNHYTNLEWVTVRENTLRAERMGLRNIRGEANGHSKYSEDYIRNICQQYEEGKTVRDVYCQLLNNPKAKVKDNKALYILLYNLKNKQIWPDVVSDYSYETGGSSEGWHKDITPIPQTSNYKYPEKMIRDICKRLENEHSVLDIIEHYTGIRHTFKTTECQKLRYLIDGIRLGKNWKNISCEYNIDPSKTIDRKPEEISEDVIRLVNEGYTKKEIRRKLGIMKINDNPVGTQRIYRMIDRYVSSKSIMPDMIVTGISPDN